MEDKITEANKEIKRLIKLLCRKVWLIVIAGILGGLIAGAYTSLCITPMYKSSTMLYVNNSSIAVGERPYDITSGDISAAKDLVDSYIVILKTRETLNAVIEYAGVDRSYSEVKRMISASAVNSTEIFEIVVTSSDPQEAKDIANAIADILPERISKIIDGTSAVVLDKAVLAKNPSSPNMKDNISFGALVCVLFIMGIILLRDFFDTTIRSEEDITRSCKQPILAMIPDMDTKTKGGYYYASGEKKKKKKSHIFKKKKEEDRIGSNLNYASAEAYKLLRTKIQFSFADGESCHIIGVSSALAGEGKSLTAVNVAYSLAQLNKKVLLIDCDLRKPTISEKTGIKNEVGLSDFLTKQKTISESLKSYSDGEVHFNIISAGTIPPNPIELLSSDRMGEAIKAFREFYDYIIMDFPPVTEVSDAVAATKLVDGMLLVTRKDFCNRTALGFAVRQFEFVDVRILGIVMNYVSDEKNGYIGVYGKKYKQYYKR